MSITVFPDQPESCPASTQPSTFGSTLLTWMDSVETAINTLEGISYTADETSLHRSGTTFSILTTWAGQTALTTLGTITTGTWHGTVIGVQYGGTGLATLTAHAVYVGNGTSAPTALSVGATNTLLHGNTGADPSWSAIVEADLSLSDVTTKNASTSAHGFLKKLDNDATHFMRGDGAWAAPAPTYSSITGDKPQTLATDSTDAGNTNTDGTQDTLYAHNMTGGPLLTNGNSLECIFSGNLVGSATATRRIGVWFGPTGSETEIFDTGEIIISANCSFEVRASILRKDSATARYSVSLIAQDALAPAQVSCGELGSLDFTSNTTLKLTGAANSTGAAANDVLAKLGRVLFVP